MGAKVRGPLGVARTGWESPMLPLGADTVSVTAPGTVQTLGNYPLTSPPISPN